MAFEKIFLRFFSRASGETIRFFEFQYYAIFFINVKNDTSRHVFGIIFGINKYKFQVVLTFLLEGHGFEVFYTL